MLEKYHKIWDKVSKVIKKRFDSEPAYNEKHLTKIKSFDRKVNANFHNDPQCICLSVVLTDSVFKIGKNYYLQGFLEECKYIIKKRSEWEY